jgi:hypothetical protein
LRDMDTGDATPMTLVTLTMSAAAGADRLAAAAPLRVGRQGRALRGDRRLYRGAHHPRERSHLGAGRVQSRGRRCHHHVRAMRGARAAPVAPCLACLLACHAPVPFCLPRAVACLRNGRPQAGAVSLCALRQPRAALSALRSACPSAASAPCDHSHQAARPPFLARAARSASATAARTWSRRSCCRRTRLAASSASS